MNTNEYLDDAVIYEANIRQYSKKGTFKAFIKDIPNLKKIGVKIIWLMPIHPISEKNRKGSLGSYYSVADYTGINPDLGTLKDLKKLVKTAHENGMIVLLDWVANHTGWDHKWIDEHPEYYTHDEHGNIIMPANTDWTDTADLNFDNQNTREAMIEAMKYWLTHANIDGFRCDMASMVPTDFWEHAVAQLHRIKPIYMLAEAWEPDLLKDAFRMGYSWDTHHIMNDVAQGKKNVEALDVRMHQVEEIYPKNATMMNFLTNHDENSWNGSIKERMGDAAEIMLALTYCIKGMPLIYSGQEYELHKKLAFFDKDEIPKKKGETWKLLEKLAILKQQHKALHSGEHQGSYQRLDTANNQRILAFSRKKEEDEVIFIGNLSAEPIKFWVDINGEYQNFFTEKEEKIAKKLELNFNPWEYKVLHKKP